MKPIKNEAGDRLDIYDIFGELKTRLFKILHAKITDKISATNKKGTIKIISDDFSNYNPQEVILEINDAYLKISEIRSLINDGKLEIPDPEHWDDDFIYSNDYSPSYEKYISAITKEITYYENELKKIEDFIERKHSLSLIEKKFKWSKKPIDLIELGYALVLSGSVTAFSEINKEEFIKYLARVLNTKEPKTIYDKIGDIKDRQKNQTKFLSSLVTALQEFIDQDLEN